MGEKKNKIWYGLKPKEQNKKHLNNNLNSKRWNNIPTNFEIEKGADNLEVKESLSRIGKDLKRWKPCLLFSISIFTEYCFVDLIFFNFVYK